MGIEKLSVASMLAGIREAAVITCLDGNIIHCNNQMKRRHPSIDNAKVMTDVFSLASKTFNVSCFKEFSSIVKRRSGLFPIRLKFNDTRLNDTSTIPAYVSVLKDAENNEPAALIYKLDEHIVRFNNRLRQLQDAKRAHAKIAREAKLKASMDSLTGLKNRRFVQSFLEMQWKAYTSKGEDTVLIIFDIDYFKQINDTYGHAAGDEAIKAFGKCLHSQTRPSDVVSRWGGEEFVVVLANCSSTQARLYLERVMTSIRQLRIKYKNVVNEQTLISMTASAGYCPFSQASSVQEAFSQADRALYEAKSEGRDQYRRACLDITMSGLTSSFHNSRSQLLN